MENNTLLTTKRLFTTKTLAQYLSFSEEHVRTLIRLGHIESIKLGHKTIRIKEEAVEKYLNSKVAEKVEAPQII